MKRIIDWLVPVLLTASVATAGDVLERPVTSTGTGATITVTFNTGSLGFLQDVVLISRMPHINTGTVYVVNSVLGHTNLVAAWVFTNNSQSRISSPWPVQQGDIVQVDFTASKTNVTESVTAWFKNVQH